tara:strand:- start:1485 stop:1766 length:282 start_codon:yes stop_codon:yes gene_type:complete
MTTQEITSKGFALVDRFIVCKYNEIMYNGREEMEDYYEEAVEEANEIALRLEKVKAWFIKNDLYSNLKHYASNLSTVNWEQREAKEQLTNIIL